jgi:outer membrane protein assembly factor BamB
MRVLLFALILVVSIAPSTNADPNWPSFRGGSRAGVAEAKTLPDVWGVDQNVVWKVEIPGRGWSSPVVWGDRVFVTSVQTDGKPLEPRKGLYIQDLNGKTPEGEHRWQVHCLDWKTGKTLWTRDAFKGKAASTIHIKNSLASETPVTDGERVYAYFGNVGLACYDNDGKEVWSQKWEPRKMRMGWGTAASPALHGDRLFIVNDNEEKKSYLVALDKRTGKEVWKVDRDEQSNWATPFVWQNEKRTEIVTAGSGKVRSYDLDGQLLWEFAGMSILSIPSPFAGNGLLYVSSGYVMDPFIKPVYAVRPGAAGDITPKADETKNDFIAWLHRQAGPYNPSPLVYDDLLYVLYDRGFLSCYEAKTGKLVYEKQRLGPGAFTASPWAYGGKVFCLSEDGDTVVVQAGREFKLLGKNSLDEMCLATPALAHGSLLIRTQGKLYRIEKKAEQP